MRIAVTMEDNQVFQHFGHTKTFALYQCAKGIVMDKELLDTKEHGHGALAGFLKEHQIDTVICGNIGDGAKEALKKAKIQLIAGAKGDVDQAVEAFLAGELKNDETAQCAHHHKKGHH